LIREGKQLADTELMCENRSIMTLTEIEQAANELPAAKRTELLLFLAESLRKEQATLPAPRQFSKEQIQQWLNEDEAGMRRFQAGA
jgi:hypothetical protein